MRLKGKKQKLVEFMRNNLPENMGAIIRTSASKANEDELLNDLNYIIGKWEKMV